MFPGGGTTQTPWAPIATKHHLQLRGPSTSNCSTQEGLNNFTLFRAPHANTEAEELLFIQGALPGGIMQMERDALWGSGGVQGTCSSAHHCSYLGFCSSEHSGVLRHTPPAPHGPLSSSITSIPSSPSRCRLVCQGSKPCLGKGLSARWGGVFDKGVHGASSLQWGYHSCPQQGRAAASPLAAQAPRGCAGASLRPRPVRSIQQTTQRQLVASHTLSPTSNPIHHGATTPLE